MEYIIHDNGGRPFKVVINGNYVSIYKRDHSQIDYWNYEEHPVLRCRANRIFIDTSKKAEPEGHAILVELEYLNGDTTYMTKKMKNTHVYMIITYEISIFETQSEIIRFETEICGSDVAYPYAVDTDGRYYILIEDTIVDLKNTSMCTDDRKYFDEFPYDGFYKLTNIKLPINDIEMFYQCEDGDTIELNELNYDSSAHYDDITILRTNGKKELLSAKDHKKLVKKVGKKIGCKRMKSIVIIGRNH
jgi:hypothetical protein